MVSKTFGKCRVRCWCANDNRWSWTLRKAPVLPGDATVLVKWKWDIVNSALRTGYYVPRTKVVMTCTSWYSEKEARRFTNLPSASNQRTNQNRFVGTICLMGGLLRWLDQSRRIADCHSSKENFRGCILTNTHTGCHCKQRGIIGVETLEDAIRFAGKVHIRAMAYEIQLSTQQLRGLISKDGAGQKH